MKALAGFMKWMDHDGPLTRWLKPQKSGLGLPLLPTALHPDKVQALVCGFCSTGCGLLAHMREGKAINISPNGQYPVNLGKACPKGWESLSVMESKQRALDPRIRRADGRLAACTWDEASSHFVTRMRALQETYGEGSLAFLSTGQMCSEEMALLGSFARFGMGMKHGDGNTRQCMATAAVAYKKSFGFDSPPYTYKDLEESDVIVLVGSNLCISHPILWQRVKQNPRSPRIIVIDPRYTETAAMATVYVPVAPKGDLLLFYGLAKILLARGWIDCDFIQASCADFDGFVDFLEDISWSSIEDATGFSTAMMEGIAEEFRPDRRVSVWWTMGVNQSHQGVSTAQAIINLCLMTGQIGKPGSGPNSITGQCNAMGSRLFSNTASLLGGRDFANPDHRAEVASILDISESCIPRTAGYAYDQILDAIHRGEIKGLWIIATNTAHSWIDQNRAKEALAKLEFLVVQDIYADTETSRFAHLCLPAAGWGEKEGTFINSERRIGLVRSIRETPGQARSDFLIFKTLAAAWDPHFPLERWSTPAAAFQILKELSRNQPCDFRGIRDHEHLDAANGIQWPSLAEDVASERRLFADGRFFHPDGRARFHYAASRPAAEQTNRDFPLVLLTGRGSSSQWHTETRTKHSGILSRLHSPSLLLRMNTLDAGALGLRNGQEVQIRSRRGSVKAHLDLSMGMRRGQVFLPMHHPDVNQLTFEEVDPQSRQPSYKYCSVAVQALSSRNQIALSTVLTAALGRLRTFARRLAPKGIG